MLNMGIIGAGLVFQNAHMKAYESRSDVRVCGVADPVEAYRQQAGARLRCDAQFEDYRHVLDNPEIQAVDICLPHHMHEEAVLAAFDAGKDVLLEKPIACALDAADRMIAAAQRKGRRFYVALNQRFYPAHRMVKELVDSGQYGPPFFAVAHVFGNELPRMREPDNWKGTWDRAGGGALADSGTHVVDLLLWWFGRPKRVGCHWGRYAVEAPNKADDNAAVTLEYEHMLAQIAVSYSTVSDPWRESKWIYLRDASLHLHFDPDKPILIGRDGQPPQAMASETLSSWWDGSVAAGIHHWLDCFQGKATPLFGPEAARDTLEVITLAYRAAAEERSITLDPCAGQETLSA